MTKPVDFRTRLFCECGWSGFMHDTEISELKDMKMYPDNWVVLETYLQYWCPKCFVSHEKPGNMVYREFNGVRKWKAPPDPKLLKK